MRKYERFGENVFFQALREQAENYQDFQPQIMIDAYKRFYERVFVDAAERGLRIVRQTNKKDFIPSTFFLTTWRNWIGDFIENDVVMRGLITNVNERTLKEIGKALGEGLELGLTTGELQRSIVEFVGNKSRAKGIAMTEATRANAEGKLRSADIWQAETGEELWKLWVHSGNPNEPRLNHIALQDKPIRKTELFNNGLDKPGDPNGSASETVRCQCTIVYVSKDYVDRFYPNI